MSNLKDFNYEKKIIDKDLNKDKKLKELVSEVLMDDEDLKKQILKFVEKNIENYVTEVLFDENAKQRISRVVREQKDIKTIDVDGYPIQIYEPTINLNEDKEIYSRPVSYSRAIQRKTSIKGILKYECKIKDILNKTGQKATWLTAKTGIPSSTLSGIINGITAVSLENAYLISIALGRSVEEVFPISIREDEK